MRYLCTAIVGRYLVRKLAFGTPDNVNSRETCFPNHDDHETVSRIRVSRITIRPSTIQFFFMLLAKGICSKGWLFVSQWRCALKSTNHDRAYSLNHRLWYAPCGTCILQNGSLSQSLECINIWHASFPVQFKTVLFENVNSSKIELIKNPHFHLRMKMRISDCSDLTQLRPMISWIMSLILC